MIAVDNNNHNQQLLQQEAGGPVSDVLLLGDRELQAKQTTSGGPAPPPPVVPVGVRRLSEVWGAGWRERANKHGDRPDIDLACSGVFRVLSEEEVAGLNRAVDQNLHRATKADRATFLRGVSDLEAVVDWDRLAARCSQVAGVSLSLHPVRQEWTHVNLQTGVQDRPVDSWHTDYVPFVLVTMLRKDPSDRGGQLELEAPLGPIDLQAGESVLLQGSHITHQANQAELGVRVSLVTSLVPSSCLHTDMTRIRYHALPLGEGHHYFEQAVRHREARLRELCLQHPHRTDRLLDEFTRYVAQMDGPIGSHSFFQNRELVELFVRTYHQHQMARGSHQHHDDNNNKREEGEAAEG